MVELWVDGMASALPDALVDPFEDEAGMNDVGRAMRTTPRKETRPATCSERVNGSFIRTQHAAQATLGARNVMTVASASGR